MKKLCVMAIAVLLSTITNANNFYLNSLDIEPDYQLWDNCAERCAQMDYRFVKTGHAWIDAIINKDVLATLDVGAETNNPAIERQVQAFYKKTTVTSAELKQQLDRISKNVVTANQQDPSPTSYYLVAKPELIGWHKGLVLMGLEADTFTGGAHGLPTYFYYVFDLQNKKSLKVDDVVIAGKKSALEQKLKLKYEAYLRQNDIDPQDWGWDFVLTDNFTFNQEGMTFLYQPYEITPYVMGLPTLELSYQELSGVILPKYLR